MSGNGPLAVQRALLDELDLIMNYYFHQGVDDVMNDLYCQCSYIDNNPRPDIVLRTIHKSGVLYQRSDKPMQQIRDALLRYVQGTLGICRRCGNEIPGDILRDTPTTDLCPSCVEEMGNMLTKRSTVH